MSDRPTDDSSEAGPPTDTELANHRAAMQPGYVNGLPFAVNQKAKED